MAGIVGEKSYKFAIRIYKLFKYLTEKKKEFVLSKQILRSGTSIGANVEEALGGQSKKDFISKLSITYNESRETSYWLRLLKDTDNITLKEYSSIDSDLKEIQKMLTAILKTSKAKNSN
ncbi:MAG: four helix bundle protein [Ignavibacteriales bacterium]|nr:MAG: four helix bundle protein [Ignavibacteriales bacterium]